MNNTNRPKRIPVEFGYITGNTYYVTDWIGLVGYTDPKALVIYPGKYLSQSLPLSDRPSCKVDIPRMPGK